MLISLQKRFIFIANTKTASSSIENSLLRFSEIALGGSPQRKHMKMQDVHRVYAFLFEMPGMACDSFFRFGVMREPLDWIESWYRYRRGNRVFSPLPEEMGFAEFWAARGLGPGQNHTVRSDGTHKLQKDAFVDADGALALDVIIPYHELEDWFARIRTGLGLKAELRKRNVSRLKRRSDIPDALRAEVRAFYAEDYAIWDQLPEINARGLEALERVARPDAWSRIGRFWPGKENAAWLEDAARRHKAR